MSLLSNNGRRQAIFLAALPHLLLAIFTALSSIYLGGLISALGLLLLIVMAMAFLLAWRQQWPVWSGSWIGYWLLLLFPLGARLSLPGLELLILPALLAVGVLLFQRHPLQGLLASSPPLLFMTRAFVFELVAGGEWVWSGVWLLLAVTAGVIVWLGSVRAGMLLLIGFHLLTGLAFALARSYLPFRFSEMGARQTPELETVVNDFVPLTLALIIILLALLLLEPLRRLASQGGRQGRYRHGLLLLGMLLTLGGILTLRAQPRLTNAASPEIAVIIASLAIAAGLMLSVGATLLLARAVWREGRGRFHPLLLPLLAAFAPLVVFALAPPFAPDGRYSDHSQTIISLSYAGVILWSLATLLVIMLSYRDGSDGLSGSKTGKVYARHFLAVLLLSCLPLILLTGCFPFMFERPPRVHEIGLADLTGNGHLDAYLNIGSGGGEPYVRPDYVLHNDGSGRFNDSQEFEGRWPGSGVVLGDLTGNGLADILLDIDGGGIVFYTNQGDNDFQLSGSSPLSGTAGPGGVMQMKPTVGDLNEDGHLDVFAAGCCGRESDLRPEGGDHLLSYSLVWLNNGRGGLVSNGQTIGQMGSNAVALADLNGNGYLDAFLANGRTLDTTGHSHTDTPNTVWFNNGEGQFQDSGQRLGEAESMAVALGDLNGNGFPDAVVGNRGPDEIWFNDGGGFFSDSRQRLGDGLTRSIFLADLDGDGDLDLVVGGETSGQVWLNDGTGRFSRGQQISYGRYDAIALGDVTGDGLVDIFVAGVESYQVWRGQGDGRFTADGRTDYR